MKAFAKTLLFVVFLSHELSAQTSTKEDEQKQTIFREAGNYSAKHDALAITVLRGVNNRDKYDGFIKAIGDKLDEKGVPYKFFQKYNDKPGTVFDYFIENDVSGPFNLNEFIAILPHAIKSYREQYPN